MEKQRYIWLFLFIFLILINNIYAIEFSNLLIVKPMGNDYVVVQPNDPYYQKIKKLIDENQELQNVILNYERVQLKKQVRLYNELRKKGLSKKQIEVIMKNQHPKPLVWNLTSASGGNSMEVKSFTVIKKDNKGNINKLKYSDTPIINLAMNGETMKGNATDIIRSIAHETGHGIMSIFYGGTFPYSEHYGEPHWRNKVTDKGLALVEGWAEMNGPLFSAKSIYRKKVENGEYVFTDTTFDLKSYSQMIATEGFAASVFLDIVENIDQGYDKILYVFEKDKPAGIEEVIKGLEKHFPADAYEIYRIFTYNSRGANVNEKEARAIYQKFTNGTISAVEYKAWLEKTTEKGWQKEAKLINLTGWGQKDNSSSTPSTPAFNYTNSGTVIKTNWNFNK